MPTPDQLAQLRTLLNATAADNGITPGTKLAMRLLAHIDAQAARITELEQLAERNELLWQGWKAKTKDLEQQLAKTHHDLLTAMVCIGERDAEIEEAKLNRSRRMTGADAIALAGQISEPVHVWARPNDSAAWVLIQIQPGNSRGIEYGMRSWQFAGPIPPPSQTAEIKYQPEPTQ